MLKRSRVLGLVLAVVVTVAVSSAPASAAAPKAGFKCLMSTYGQTASGKIAFRRVVNARVQVSKTTRGSVSWRPISWGLASANSWPGHQTMRQIVAATDGKVRLVETSWSLDSSVLQVRVIKELGHGFPRRLVTFDGQDLYWVAADGSLHRATWNGSRLKHLVTLPVTIHGAVTMTSYLTDGGPRIYYTDRDGALHALAVDGARSTDTVIRSTGYGTVTGMRTGDCMSPDYTEVRPSVGLLFVDRATGIGRFQRVLHAASSHGGSVTRSVRVPPSDWTWRRLG